MEGKIIFIFSYILDELEKYIDSFILLFEGKLLYLGLINDLEKDNNYFNIKIKVNNYLFFKLYLEVNNIDFYIENDILYCNFKINEDKNNLVKEILKLNFELILIIKNI